MNSAMGWVLFGFAVWAAVIFLKALQNRFAPEMNSECGMGKGHKSMLGDLEDDLGIMGGGSKAARDQELEELRKRVEVLEAIVTDRKFQWESDLDRGRRAS